MGVFWNGLLLFVALACSARTVPFSFQFGARTAGYLLCPSVKGGSPNYSLFGNPVSFPLQVAKAVTQALNRCVSCLPGQRDVDNALRAVGDASKRLLSDSVGLGTADGGLSDSGLLL